MLADLDLLLIAVFCTADDLLPEKAGNARRGVTDAEVVTLCVAQAILGVSSDRHFLALAPRLLGHLFPRLPKQPGFHKHRRRLTDMIEWLTGMFAAQSPGYYDELVLLGSTPVECGRSVETVRRSDLADAAGYGYCRAHSRWFWGMSLHLLAAPDGTPRAAILAPADQKEREVALRLLPIGLRGGETIIADKGYAGREFEQAVAERFGAQMLRPRRADDPTSRQSANASSRSSGHSRTASGSSYTEPAPSPGCALASLRNCERWPPASGSTTRPANRHEHSRHSPHNAARP